MSKAIQAVVGMIIAFGLALGQLPAEPPDHVITGTVVDASGAAITGAKVSLRFQVWRMLRTTDSVPVAVTKTDGKGEFQFVVGDILEFRLVPEATCFNPTIIEGISGERHEHNELPPIILQMSACSGDAVEPLPVMTDPDPSESSKSLESSKTVKIVTVCELLENLKQYNNTDVAVVGRLDEPADKVIDHYVVQDHCEHPIVTTGYVWPSKVLIFSQGRLDSLAQAPSDVPELDQVVLAEKVSAVQKTTKHTEPRLSQLGNVRSANVRDEWIVAYGRIFCSPYLAREACRSIGCSGFIGGAPLVMIVEPKNVHVINQDGTLRRASEQDGK